MTEPVLDWATDYDIFDQGYIRDPFGIWDDLRDRCPVAHSDRYGGSWLPTTYAEVTAIAHDVQHFSSARVAVVPPAGGPSADGPQLPAGLPPISSDPPVHTWSRRLLLPWFSPQRVAEYEPTTRALCRRLVDGFVDKGRADVAAGYAQQIPVRVIGMLLGVPEDHSDMFTGWVRDVLEFATDEARVVPSRNALLQYFQALIEERRDAEGSDLISFLLHAEVDGEKVPEAHVLGTAALALIAGVDTTWSAIGSALWHLAGNPGDLARLVAEPELMPTAVEELLRAYSPVTMGRMVTEDVEHSGCPMKAGDRILLSFPAANRDPSVFPDADKVIIDREHNRHVAFGSGIHRCAGSNLARMELRVAIEEFIARIPSFHLDPASEVTWAGGQVRGPRNAWVLFP
ncbi:MAG TPA: cytochrome P450 [Ilumatobacteraceae bacterium]|nr:cytochrome P450 [Ilumatobacteraceae bacterium]